MEMDIKLKIFLLTVPQKILLDYSGLLGTDISKK